MEAKVKWPALGLVVVGALGVVLGLLNVLGVGGVDPSEVEEELRETMELANQFGRGFGVLVVLVSGFVVWAGLKMKRLEGRVPAIVACFLAMTPLTSCGCLVGFVVGIWGLIVLFSAEAKAAFDGGPAAG